MHKFASTARQRVALLLSRLYNSLILRQFDCTLYCDLKQHLQQNSTKNTSICSCLIWMSSMLFRSFCHCRFVLCGHLIVYVAGKKNEKELTESDESSSTQNFLKSRCAWIEFKVDIQRLFNIFLLKWHTISFDFKCAHWTSGEEEGI